MNTPAEREILGQWWQAATPNEKWLGTLTLKANKSPRLHVTVPKGFFNLPKWQDSPVLHGEDKHGEPVTLLFPGPPSTRGSTALSEMVFTPGYAVLGIQLPTPEDFKIHALTLGIQHLHEWCGISGLVDEPSTINNFHVRYNRPPDQSFVINADLTLEIRACSFGHHGFNERLIREDTCIGIQSQAGLNITQCKEILTAIRHLLHFAVLKPVYPLWIKAEKNGHGYTANGRFISHEIELWSSIIRERVESEFQPERWVFRFSDVQPRFALFFADWLKFCAAFDEAIKCYSTTVYHRLPDSVEHLCLTQALEAYHGNKFGKHSFIDRIRALCQQFLPHLTGLIPDAAGFAEQVRDNRNYYTHHDPAIKHRGRVLSGANLLRLNEKLRLLFQMCVLSEMGIPPDRFQRLRRQLATYIIDIT